MWYRAELAEAPGHLFYRRHVDFDRLESRIPSGASTWAGAETARKNIEGEKQPRNHANYPHRTLLGDHTEDRSLLEDTLPGRRSRLSTEYHRRAASRRIYSALRRHGR